MPPKMKYLKLFEDFTKKYRSEPKFVLINLPGDIKVYLNPNLCNFNGEDVQDIFNEFRELAVDYKLKLVDCLEVSDEFNQYEIMCIKNISIDILVFDNIEFVRETIDEDCKSFIQRMKAFGWGLPSDYSFSIESHRNSNNKEYLSVTIVFSKNKIFEDFSEVDAWDSIQSALDVSQLYELLVFKYGPIFTDTRREIDEYDGDYNPDHVYEVIEMELKNKKIWDEFIKHWEEYQNEKEEADPFHWKHRKKAYDELSKSFGDGL